VKTYKVTYKEMAERMQEKFIDIERTGPIIEEEW
jgi:hypothetical protein